MPHGNELSASAKTVSIPGILKGFMKMSSDMDADKKPPKKKLHYRKRTVQNIAEQRKSSSRLMVRNDSNQ